MATYQPPAYTVPAIVEAIHGVPRIRGDSNFSPTSSSYWVGVSTIPMALGILGVAFLLLYFGVACCIKCCRKKEDRKKPHWACRILVLLALVGVAGGTLYAFVQNRETSTGVDTVSSGVGDYYLLFDKGELAGTAVQSLTSLAAQDATQLETDCPILNQNGELDQLKQQLSDASAQMGNFVNVTVELRNVTRDAKDYIDKYNDYRELATTISLGVTLGLGITCVLMVLVAWAKACRGCLKLGVPAVKIIGGIVAALVMIAVGGELVVAIVGSDYCVKPDENLLAQLKSSQSAYDMVGFVVNCQGTNSLVDQVTQANAALNQTAADLATLRQAAAALCPAGLPTVDDLQLKLNSSQAILLSAEELVGCASVNPPYITTIHNGLCTKLVPSVAKLWAGSLLSACCLQLMLLCFRQGAGDAVLPAALDQKQQYHDLDEGRPVTGGAAPPANRSQKQHQYGSVW